MARKTLDYTVTAEGRDIGKVFRITEMSAIRAEKWAIRALQAIAATGIELPDNINDTPLASLAVVGLQALAKVPFDVAEPLLDEMLTCVEVIPTPEKPNVKRPLKIDYDIEEPGTIVALRKEILTLHMGFSSGDPSQTTDSFNQDKLSTAHVNMLTSQG